jgi:succinate-acetate transporter protein
MEPAVRIFVRPLASALPLGFFAFAIGMLMLGVIPLGWAPASDQHTVGLLLAAFVFPLELICAIVAFLARDTFGATGLGLFTTSWLAFGLVLLQGQPGERSHAIGLWELVFATAVVLLAVFALTGKPLFSLLLTLSAARAVLAGVWELGGSHGVEQAGGVLAVVICAVALYGAVALLIEDVRQEAVLPVGRVGASKRSIEGDLSEQLARVTKEAGVRQQL